MPAPDCLLILGSLELDDLAVQQPREEQSCTVFLTVLTSQFNFLELNAKNPGCTLLSVSLSKGPAAR